MQIYIQKSTQKSCEVLAKILALADTKNFIQNSRHKAVRENYFEAHL